MAAGEKRKHQTPNIQLRLKEPEMNMLSCNDVCGFFGHTRWIGRAKISLVKFPMPFMFAAGMKLITFPLRSVLGAVLAALILIPTVAPAQVPGAGGNMMNSALLKLFGNHTAFSCKAEIHALDAIQKEIDVVPFAFAVADGKMRLDIDFAQLKNPDIPPAMIPTLKQIGMDQSTFIQRPDLKIVLSIYPHAKAYSEKPMSKEEIAAYEKTYTIAKDKLGRETVDGHACDKYKVTLTDDKGAKQVATVWNATDLKDFPVQIQMTAENTTLIMKFRDVKLSRPEPSRFEAPGGLTKYKSDDAIMEAATKAHPAK
jgi:hypothetical protein